MRTNKENINEGPFFHDTSYTHTHTHTHTMEDMHEVSSIFVKDFRIYPSNNIHRNIAAISKI